MGGEEIRRGELEGGEMRGEERRTGWSDEANGAGPGGLQGEPWLFF